MYLIKLNKILVRFTKKWDCNLCKFLPLLNLILSSRFYLAVKITKRKFNASIFESDSPMQLNTYDINQPLFTINRNIFRSALNNLSGENKEIHNKLHNNVLPLW